MLIIKYNTKLLIQKFCNLNYSIIAYVLENNINICIYFIYIN